MQSDSRPDAPFYIEHTSVCRDLGSLRRTLDELARSAFHVVDDIAQVSYRATPAAIADYGHAAIQESILRVATHETGRTRAVNVDIVHHHILHDPLVVLRAASDGAVWVLLGSEYRGALSLPWPSNPTVN